MASASSYFNPTSPFLECVSQMSTKVMISLLMKRASENNMHLSDQIRAFFSEELVSYTKLDFQRCLIDILRFTWKIYVDIHQQIIETKLEKSDLNPNDPDHDHYSALDKLLSQNDGYRHLNCLFDGFVMFSMLQFQYISRQLSDSTIPKIILSSQHCLAHMNMLELHMFKDLLQKYLTEANENLENLYNSNDQYKDRRLQCQEDDSCQLSLDNLQQLLKNQQESIEQQMRDHFR